MPFFGIVKTWPFGKVVGDLHLGTLSFPLSWQLINFTFFLYFLNFHGKDGGSPTWLSAYGGPPNNTNYGNDDISCTSSTPQTTGGSGEKPPTFSKFWGVNLTGDNMTYMIRDIHLGGKQLPPDSLSKRIDLAPILAEKWYSLYCELLKTKKNTICTAESMWCFQICFYVQPYMWGNDVKLTNVFKMVWSQQGIDTSCLWFPKKNPPVARRMGGKGEQNSASDKAIKGELFEMMTEFPGPGL